MTAERKFPKSLTQADFQLIADHCYDVTRKIVRRKRSVKPVCIAGTVEDGKVVVQLSTHVPMETEHDKEMVPFVMEALVLHADFDFVVHICEAWTAPVKDGVLPQGSLANHPKRQEIVVFNIMSKDCQTVVINPLHRNPSRLKPGKVDFSLKVRGRMVRDPETKH